MGKKAIFPISPVSGVCPDLPKMVHFGPFGGSEPPDLAIWTPEITHFGPLFGGLNGVSGVPGTMESRGLPVGGPRGHCKGICTLGNSVGCHVLLDVTVRI